MGAGVEMVNAVVPIIESLLVVDMSNTIICQCVVRLGLGGIHEDMLAPNQQATTNVNNPSAMSITLLPREHNQSINGVGQALTRFDGMHTNCQT